MEPETMGNPPERSATEALERFAACVAHDFNNLLTGMLGNLELMQNRARRQGLTEFDAYLDGARSSGARAALFAQRLLAFSGRAGQAFNACPVDALAAVCVESLGAQGPDIALALAAPGASVMCDASQAELALNEVLSNAADACKESGSVTLRTALTPGFVILTISDTGAGMEDEVLARALEPFFTTRPNGAGKGLGLCIAARFATEAGGSLSLASQPGHGTTVTFTLPVLPA